jgi:hypothetical protein
MHACIHTYIYTHTHINTDKLPASRLHHAYIYTCMYTYIHLCIHTDKLRPSRIHHTYIHTYIRIHTDKLRTSRQRSLRYTERSPNPPNWRPRNSAGMKRQHVHVSTHFHARVQKHGYVLYPAGTCIHVYKHSLSCICSTVWICSKSSRYIHIITYSHAHVQ